MSESNEKYKNVLFDLDGTIIDSSECIFAIYRNLFAEYGIPNPAESVLRTYIGPPVEYVLKGYFDDEEERKKAADRFRELYGKIDLRSANKLYPGIVEAIASLKKSGKKLFIASTKNEKTANKVLDLIGISRYFDGIYGSRYEINRLKKVQVIEAIINDFHLKKEESVLIGDTHFDAEGALMANIPVIIVKYGFADFEKLKEYPVVKCLDSTREIAEI